ncbi:hypothetical protein YK48G_13790 [Lentilactobacillus fungorum]|uniref:Uncharacterized protein n=1 Tax=Lentilactobacillus fungorum TaxID=2201250 RepID=A0ABQ3W1B2_9LACO|nr:hypothetical protein [Lentilactobacillus fungorum]GHP13954.1 hypothetical protein YK48G_13790 [Lentilactobacillus fungorum]
MELGNTEKLIINRLIDQELFTSTPEPTTTKVTLSAIRTYKQRRVYRFFDHLIGTQPLNYGNNLVLLVGPGSLTNAEKHVLLATLKAVISSPEMDGLASDMVIDSQSIIQQVHSEVLELDEPAIYAIIDQLFVKRFGLFTPDYPEGDEASRSEIMDPFWDINPDFTSITHEMIAYMMHPQDTGQLSDCQRINRVLLRFRYLSPHQFPELWPQLVANKEQLAAEWQPLARFRLECGQDYAILLDNQQKKSEAKPLIVAIALANQLNDPIKKTNLTTKIRQVAKALFPGRTVNPTDVKKSLLTNALVIETGDYYQPTPVAKRFKATNDADQAVFE